jgi:transketolase
LRQQVPPDLVASLKERARAARIAIMEMLCTAGSGHPGGSLSAVEVLTVLYHHVLKVDPERPDWPDRDRFVLSKGHASAALYATLSSRGFFSPSEFARFRQVGGILQGHPDRRKTPGVDMSTGSLGQGLSLGIGMALAARHQRRDYHVYVLLGDGEIQEGQVWEAAMAAGNFRLSNLTAVLDYNKVQLDGPVPIIMDIEPVVEKWHAFKWATLECDGHDVEDLIAAFDEARKITDQPVIIIARTVKGKGVSFMEHQSDWHGVSDPSRLPEALAEVQRS